MAEMDNVSKKIIEDAKKRKEEILNEAREKVSVIIKEAEGRAKEIYRNGKMKAQDKYKQVFDMELDRAKMELKQKIISYKISLIDEVIGRAKDELSNLGKKEYKKFLEKIFGIMDIEKGFYQIGSEEKNVNGKMIESIANLKKADGKPDFKKGIKIIKKKAEYNITADSLIDSNIDDIGMETAINLFGKEK